MTDSELTLALGVLQHPEVSDEATIQERFEAFDRHNSWVYVALETLTIDWLARGHRRAGIKQLMEVIRWQYGRQTVGDTFRLNNNFTSRYVLLLIERHPEWAEVFETRVLRAS